MRFSLSTLFRVVTIAAVACALVIYGSHHWTDALVIPTALLLASSAAWGIGRRDKTHVMARAFALVGGFYLLVASTRVSDVLHDCLPTYYPIAIAARVLLHPMWGPETPEPVPFDSIYYDAKDLPPNDLCGIPEISHCIFALLLGLVAAWLAGRMYSRCQREPGTRTRLTPTRIVVAEALVTVAFLGMIFPYRWCGQVVLGLSVLLYLATAMASFTMRGRDRVAAIAFTVVGAAYLAEVTIDRFRDLLQLQFTNQLLVGAWNLLPDPRLAVISHGDPEPFRSSLRNGVNLFYDGDAPFFLIGHCLFSWLFALLAGWLAAAIYSRRERGEACE